MSVVYNYNIDYAARGREKPESGQRRLLNYTVQQTIQTHRAVRSFRGVTYTRIISSLGKSHLRDSLMML